MAANSTAQRVVRSFLAGKRDASGAMKTDGTRLYTYGVLLAYRTPMYDEDGGTVYVTPAMARKYSVSSSRHQNAVRAILPGNTEIRNQGKETYGTLSNPRVEWYADRSYSLNNFRHVED